MTESSFWKTVRNIRALHRRQGKGVRVRGCVQYLDGGLSGNSFRPGICGHGGSHDLSAYRQLRRGDDDFESRVLSVGALIVREYNDSPSNFRYTKTLSEILEENRIPGIEGLDTRKLTRSIRDSGSMRALITTPDMPVSRALEIISNAPAQQNTAADVSCKKKWYSRTSNHKFNVVAVDCGIKLSLIRSLMSRGCNVTVMPWNTGAEEIEKINPDGVIVSSGRETRRRQRPLRLCKGAARKVPDFRHRSWLPACLPCLRRRYV